jgi:hypothetical protein
MDDRRRGGRVAVTAEISLITVASRPALGSTPSSIQWVLEVKHQGRKANLSVPLSAEVKNEWSYISTPPHAFMLLCVIKHRDDFNFNKHLTDGTVAIKHLM